MRLSRKLRFFLHRPRALAGLWLRSIRPARDLPGADAFDLEWGVDTAGITHLWDLEVVGSNDIHGTRHQPCNPVALRRSLESLDIGQREFVFIDLGSGKGRGLLVAAQFAFSKAVGVDFSPDLVACCRKNLAESRKPPRCEVEVVCMDAAEYEFPEENLVLFLYNPFDNIVLSKILARLRVSLKRNPRDVFVIYQGPQRKALSDCSFLVPLAESVFRASVRPGAPPATPGSL